jgi:superoxide dismutase, Fe-Mn family
MHRTLFARGAANAYVPRKAVPAQLTGTAAFRYLEAAVRDQNTEKSGWFNLPRLQFSAHDGIAPVWSPEQVRIMHDVVHRDIVQQLNDATFGSSVESHSIDVVVRHTAFDATRAFIHVPACEHLNHALMWRSVKPFGVACPQGLVEELDLQFASTGAAPGTGLQHVRDELQRLAVESDVPGWVFLVLGESGQFEIRDYAAGTSPVTADVAPLLCINTQYHAYHGDYGVAGREAYISNVVRAIDWAYADSNWRTATEKRD